MIGSTLRRNTAALRRVLVKRTERIEAVEREAMKRLESIQKRYTTPSPLIFSLLVLDIIPPSDRFTPKKPLATPAKK